MRRPWIIAVLGLFLGAGGFAGLYLGRTAASRELEEACGPELAWLKKEFNLGDAEFERVRALHEGYRPVCAESCKKIDDENRRVARLLGVSTNVTPEIQQALGEAAQLRARCYAQMLKHFYQVSQAMPPEQGRRYLSWMHAATLAPTHESMLPRVDAPVHDGHSHSHAH